MMLDDAEQLISAYGEDPGVIQDSIAISLLNFVRFARNAQLSRNITVKNETVTGLFINNAWFSDTTRFPSFDHVKLEVDIRHIDAVFEALGGRRIRKVTFCIPAGDVSNMGCIYGHLAKSQVEVLEIINASRSMRMLLTRGILRILAVLPTLKSLTISNFTFVEGVTDDMDDVRHETMEELNLRSMYAFNCDSGFYEKILSALPNLKRLIFSETEKNCDVLLSSSRCTEVIKQLRVFELNIMGSVNRIVDRVLVHLLPAMHQLENFRMAANNTPGTYLTRIAAAATQASKLRHLLFIPGQVSPFYIFDSQLLPFNAKTNIETFVLKCVEHNTAGVLNFLAKQVKSFKHLRKLKWDVMSSKEKITFEFPDNVNNSLNILHFADDSDGGEMISHAISLAAKCPYLEEVALSGNFFNVVDCPPIFACVQRLTIDATHNSSVFALNFINALKRPDSLDIFDMSSLQSSTAQYAWLAKWFSRAKYISKLRLSFTDEEGDLGFERNTFKYLRELRELDNIVIIYNTLRGFSPAALFTAVAELNTVTSLTINSHTMTFTEADEAAYLHLMSTTGIITTAFKQTSAQLSARTSQFASRNIANYNEKRKNLMGILLENMRHDAKMSARFQRIE